MSSFEEDIRTALEAQRAQSALRVERALQVRRDDAERAQDFVDFCVAVRVAATTLRQHGVMAQTIWRDRVLNRDASSDRGSRHVYDRIGAGWPVYERQYPHDFGVLETYVGIDTATDLPFKHSGRTEGEGYDRYGGHVLCSGLFDVEQISFAPIDWRYLMARGVAKLIANR